MNRLRLVAASALIACAPLAAGPWIAEPVAVAQAPTTYTDVVTDNAGVLSEAEKGKLVEAIQDVQRKEQRKIYVVFTEDFGGLSGEEWAKQAKQRNDGRNVLVYGVVMQCFAWGLIAYAIPLLSLSLTGLLLLSEPVAALLIDYFLLSKPINGWQWIGAALTLAAIYLGSLKKNTA